MTIDTTDENFTNNPINLDPNFPTITLNHTVNSNMYDDDDYFENEDDATRENYKQIQVLKLTEQIITINKLLLLFLLFFSLMFLYSYSSIGIDTTKTFVVSPTEYYSNSNYLVIKPCIYDDKILPTSKYCYSDYELISTYDLCSVEMQTNSYICLLDNITHANPNVYYPTCSSIYWLNQLYNDCSKECQVNNNSMIINPNYYQNSIFLILISCFAPLFLILLLVCYIRKIYRHKDSDDVVDNCMYMYKQFVIYCALTFINFMVMYGGMTAILKSASVKFIAEIFSINCSNYDIFDSLSLVQKICLSLSLNGLYSNYNILKIYYGYFNYVYSTIIVVTVLILSILMYFLLRIGCLKLER